MIAIADRIVAQLDALGRPALKARLAARTRLLEFSSGVAFDQSRVRREAEEILALLRPLSGDSLINYKGSMQSAYRGLLALAYFYMPDSIPAIARRAQKDLNRTFRRYNGDECLNGHSDLRAIAC